MGANGIQLGDRVINLQVPGIFTVIDRTNGLVVIQTQRGLRMAVYEAQLRRVDDGALPPSDA